MGAVQKSNMSSSRRPDFRRQLQRALSLSSIETSDSRNIPKSSKSDTTEEQQSVLSEGDRCEGGSDSIGHGHQAQIDPALFPSGPPAVDIEEQTDLPRDADIIALECVSELDLRMRNVEHSLNKHANVNDMIRANLTDIFGRVAIMEEKISMVSPVVQQVSPENRRSERERLSRQ